MRKWVGKMSESMGDRWRGGKSRLISEVCIRYVSSFIETPVKASWFEPDSLLALQTVMTSTPSHVFSVSPLIHFATSFLTTLTSLPASFFLEDLYELQQIETSYSSPAHLVFAWLERLAQELIRMSLPLAAQNRPRQFRWIRKSCIPPDSTWSQFLEDTRTIIPVLSSIAAQQKEPVEIRNGVEQLETVVRGFFLELALESVCSGFEDEMQLYEEDERSRIWFGISQLAEELEDIWSGMEQAKGGKGGYLKAKLGEVRSIKEMARGSLIVSLPSFIA